ncbi:hypothetical protein D3C80_1611950 [compost metagenome]
MVPPTASIDKPKAAILSRSTCTLISGLPSSTESLTSLDPLVAFNSANATLAKAITLSRSVPITTTSTGARLAVPNKPTGVVLIFTPGSLAINSFFSLAA